MHLVDAERQSERVARTRRTAELGAVRRTSTPVARQHLARPRDGYPFSVTVVRGCRAAVAAVTYLPVTALRWAVPLPPLLRLRSVTVVRGLRAAALRETYRPVAALLLLPFAMTGSFL